jgi:hypothetical protein
MNLADQAALIKRFEDQIGKLVEDSLQDGTPIKSMIFILGDEEFKLRIALEAVRAQQVNMAQAKTIIAARPGIDFKNGRNGA